MVKPTDLTGQQFGRLTVIKRAENYKNGSTRWLCKCTCGKEKTIAAYSLKTGRSQSCGCLRNEGNHITHGMSNKRIYSIWRNLKQRCRDKKSTNYPRYGGRGVAICDEWHDSFETFRDWALANGYRDDLTIDRIDVNGNYEPVNCRWATYQEQQNNKRNNHIITAKGRTQTLQQWADETGIKSATIRYRIKHGWTKEKSVTEPTQERNSK